MTDRLTCFTTLSQNLPKWIDSLSTLNLHIKERPTSPEPVSASDDVEPIKKKTDSVESLRDVNLSPPSTPQHISDSQPRHNTASPPTSMAVLISTPPAANTPTSLSTATPTPSRTPQENLQHALARKRKPPSLASGQASGPPKSIMRSVGATRRNVYYDGEVQRGLEQLVRHVAGARNMLRKAKMQAKMEALNDSMLDDIISLDMPTPSPGAEKTGYTFPGKSSRVPRVEGLGQPLDISQVSNVTLVVFDQCDKALEGTQMFTERAAYTFLRNGEAQAEFDGAHDRLKQALHTVARELDRLSRTKPATPPAAPKTEENKVEPEEDAKEDSKPVEVDSQTTLVPPAIVNSPPLTPPSSKMMLPALSSPLPESTPKVTPGMIIAADDESEEYTPMAMMAFRRTTQAH